MDSVAIRRDCAEAHDLAVRALDEGVDPTAAQVEQLREALVGHLRGLVEAVRETFADAPPGPLRDVVHSAMALADRARSHEVRGDVLDLIAPPPVVRLLLLMFEDPEAFGALAEEPAPLDGRRESV